MQRQEKKGHFLFSLIVGIFLCLVGVLGLLELQTSPAKNEDQLLQHLEGSVQLYFNTIKKQVHDWVTALKPNLQRLNQKSFAEWEAPTLSAPWNTSNLLFLDSNGQLITQQNINSPYTNMENKALYESFLQSPAHEYLQKNAYSKNKVSTTQWLNGKLYFIVQENIDTPFISAMYAFFPIGEKQIKELTKYLQNSISLLSDENADKISKHVKEQNGNVYIANVPSQVAEAITPKRVKAEKDKDQEAISVRLIKFRDSNHLGQLNLLLIPEKSKLDETLAWLFAVTILAGLSIIAHRFVLLRKTAKISVERTSKPSSPANSSDTQISPEKEQTSPNAQIFFDDAPIGMFSCTMEGQIISMNQCFAQMLDLDPSLPAIKLHKYLHDFCAKEEDKATILQILHDEPQTKHTTLLKPLKRVSEYFDLYFTPAQISNGTIITNGFLLKSQLSLSDLPIESSSLVNLGYGESTPFAQNEDSEKTEPLWIIGDDKVQTIQEGLAQKLSTAFFTDSLHDKILSKKILIIDDNTDERLQISFILNDQYLVSEAETIEESLNIFNEEIIDLVLIDIDSTKQDGIQLISVLRVLAHERDVPHMPIIGIVSNNEEALIEQCISAGSTTVITKPFTKTELLARVQVSIEA